LEVEYINSLDLYTKMKAAEALGGIAVVPDDHAMTERLVERIKKARLENKVIRSNFNQFLIIFISIYICLCTEYSRRRNPTNLQMSSCAKCNSKAGTRILKPCLDLVCNTCEGNYECCVICGSKVIGSIRVQKT